MLKIEGLRLSPGEPPSALKSKAAKLLRVGEGDILSLQILRRSVDAREAPVFLYRVAAEVRDEASALRRGGRKVSRYAPPPAYRPPSAVAGSAQPPVIIGAGSTQPPAVIGAGSAQPPVIIGAGSAHVATGAAQPPAVIGADFDRPPVVIGAGPAGLFAALVLARAGLRPVLLERGQPVERRRADVARFREGGALDPESNVQFGEGGAGAFSDGKLNTGTRDPRHRFILETLAAHGAPPEILYDARPHVGTDRLFHVLRSLREELLSLGADIRFGRVVTGFRRDGNRLAALEVGTPDGAEILPCSRAALAIGHSARDTFEALYRCGVPMEPKPFAVGVRIEHRQADIDAAQYREYAGSPGLPAASYQLSCHLADGRGVFSFCVCPGGEVIAAASEPGRVVTNGMSQYARDGENINGGLLVGVTPSDFGAWASDWGAAAGVAPPDFGASASDWRAAGPLAGIAFQRRLEEAAFRLGGGNFYAPAQRVEDFLSRRASSAFGRVRPSYRPGAAPADLRECLPPFVSDALEQALPILGRKLKGFDAPDAVLTAVESRSSSPVRILRGVTGQSALQGLYPCGEGAGYAGGILSAAADGVKCAERICNECAGIQA